MTAIVFANTLFVDANFLQEKTLAYASYAKTARNLAPQKALELNYQPSKISNFGVGEFDVWCKLEIQNQGDKREEIYLTNARAGMDEIDVYVFTPQNQRITYLLGDSRGSEDREFIDRFSSFNIELEAGEKATIFIRQTNFHGPIEATWLAQSKKRYAQTRFYDTIFWGAFAGLIVSLMIYNFSIFMAIGKPEYFYYSLLSFFFLTTQLQISGVLHAIAPDPLVGFINEIAYPSVLLSMLSALAFNFYFFDIKRNFPKLAIIYKTLFAIFIAQTTLAILGLNFIKDHSPLNVICFASSLIFMIFVGFLALKRNISGARFYIIGQGVFFIVHFLTTLFINGNSETTIWVYMIIPTSIFIDMVFLSFALSVRIKNINTLKQKHEKLIVFFSHINNASGMINGIIHQWKKPIANLGAIFTELQIVSKFGLNPKESLDNKIDLINNNLAMLQNTVQEFYDIYKYDGEVATFEAADEIRRIENILLDNIEKTNSQISYEPLKKVELKTNRQAFFHAFLIVVNNALEAAKKRDIKEPRIWFEYEKNDKTSVFFVYDNCGGIDEKRLESIFEMNPSDGMATNEINGIGLPMAKMLIEERLQGDIKAANAYKGCVFKITVKNSD